MTAIVSKVVHSDAPGANKPVYRFQVFAPGDVPAHVTCPVSGITCRVADRYEDGSAKVAEIMGLVDTTSGPVTLPLNLASSADTNPVTFTPVTVTIEFVGLGTATLNFTTQGQSLSATVAGSKIQGWATVHQFTDGNYRIDPWIEATDITQTQGTVYTRQVIVKIGTTTLYDTGSAITFYAFCMPRLLSGQNFEGYYKNGASDVYVAEDIEYLIRTPLVQIDFPARATEDSSWLSAARQGPWWDEDIGTGGVPCNLTLSPMDHHQQRPTRADTGQGCSIGNLPTGWVQFITSNGGRQSFKAAICNDMAIGTYSTFPMDPVTGDAVKIVDHPTLFWSTIAGTYGANNPMVWEDQHGTMCAVLTYLLTGSEWAYRQAMMQTAGYQLLNDYRDGDQGDFTLGIYDPGHAFIERGMAWANQCLWHSSGIARHGSPMRTENMRMLNNNVDWNYDVFITGTKEYAIFVNPLGWPGRLGSSDFGTTDDLVEAVWMADFIVGTMMRLLFSGMLDSGRQTKLQAYCAKLTGMAIGPTGDGVTTAPYNFILYKWRLFHGTWNYGVNYPDWCINWRDALLRSWVVGGGSESDIPAGPVTPGTPFSDFGAGFYTYLAQQFSALTFAYRFEQLYGAVDPANSAARILALVMLASNAATHLMGTGGANTAMNAQWLSVPMGARWDGTTLTIPNPAPAPPPPPPAPAPFPMAGKLPLMLTAGGELMVVL